MVTNSTIYTYILRHGTALTVIIYITIPNKTVEIPAPRLTITPPTINNRLQNF